MTPPALRRPRATLVAPAAPLALLARRARVPLVALLAGAAAAFLAGCPKEPAPAAADAGARATADAAVTSLGDAGADAKAAATSADGGARATAKGLTREQRKAVLTALDAGRKRSRAKDFAGALADFDRALAVAPDDARVLAEVGFAALRAGDLARAASANKRALAHVRDKNLRAQILYNAGRVAEAKNDLASARKAYAESLALRDDAEVRRRLAAAGGTPPSDALCASGGPTPEALCTCLLGHKDDLMSLDDRYACAPTTASLTLGTPRLSVIRWGAAEDSAGERVHVLAARDGATMRPVAELGVDYEPGAFGVHNEAKVLGGEARAIGKRSVVVVRSRQNDLDTNMAGLEACTHVEDRETVCALGEGARPTRCAAVAVSTESGCDAGAEPEDPDDETKATLAELKKGWGKTSTKRTWSLEDDGTLVVRDADGAKAVVARHALF